MDSTVKIWSLEGEGAIQQDFKFFPTSRTTFCGVFPRQSMVVFFCFDCLVGKIMGKNEGLGLELGLQIMVCVTL